MPTDDLKAGRTAPLLIPEPIRREWKINGVNADSLEELQEHGSAVGYEFDWGQIIEEVEEGDTAAEPKHPEGVPYLALRWHFVLCGVHTEFLDGGGKLGELSDLAINVLAELEQSRDELPADSREDVLPACICFDEGNNISAFAVGVLGRSNITRAREWVSSFFIPAVLPLIIDRLRGENQAAIYGNAADTALH
jgi:hypothetical protein